MYHRARRLWLVPVVLLAIAIGHSGPARAQNSTKNGTGGSADLAKQALKEAASTLKGIDNDIIVITKELNESKAEKPKAGPPPKAKMIRGEARERLQWLKATRDQLKDRINKARHAKNSAEAQVYAKDALLKADSARHLSQSIIGPPPSAKTAKGGAPSGRTQTSGPKRSMTGGISFKSSTFDQLKTITNPESQAAAREKSLINARERAEKAFDGDGAGGRAGAGGVALYMAATVTPALDRSKLESAKVDISTYRVPYQDLYQERLKHLAEQLGRPLAPGQARALGADRQLRMQILTETSASTFDSTPTEIEKARVVLTYDGKPLAFPPLDPQFLAIAIRSVYGGEGMVHGTLHAIEDVAIVLRTGKEKYGEVVWKKEFLNHLPGKAALGEKVALDLGPGVGVLSLPEPSTDRTTYYGPVKGNILGKVLQDADKVFSMFWTGVDWKTGKPLDPTKLPGYDNRIEIDLRQPAQPKVAAKKSKPEEKAKNWWDTTGWYVWVPNEMSLRVSEKDGKFEFIKASMKCRPWNARKQENERWLREGAYLTEHYDDLSQAFPVLAQLREAAKTVAIVRWLKENRVPLDLAWAKTFNLEKVETPEKIQRFTVNIYRDKDGKPRIEEPVAEAAK